MDYKNIQELTKTVSDSQITSFEIETEGIRIKMEKKDKQVVIERKPVNITPFEQGIDPLTKKNIAANVEKLENDIARTIKNNSCV